MIPFRVSEASQKHLDLKSLKKLTCRDVTSIPTGNVAFNPWVKDLNMNRKSQHNVGRKPVN